MKSVLFMLCAMILVGCATSPVGKQSGGFDEALESINADLGKASFQTGAVSTFEKAGACKGNYKSTWTKATSAAKGFAAVETTTLVDFASDVQRAEYVKAHDDIKADHIERWADSIRVHFTKPLPSMFKSMRIGETEMSAEDNPLDFITVGVSSTATGQQIASLVHELNRAVELCKETL